MKKKRIVDKALLKELKGSPCKICGSTYGSAAHHIRTKKSGGDDIDENLIALCFMHHRLAHDNPDTWMCDNYPEYKRLLIEKGWVFELDKWRRYE